MQSMQFLENVSLVYRLRRFTGDNIAVLEWNELIPPLAGCDGHFNAPLPFANFLNNLKTSADINAKFTVPDFASIWRPYT